MIKRLLAVGVVVCALFSASPVMAGGTNMPDGVGTPPSPNSTPGGGAGCAGGVSAFLGFRSWDACLQKDANGVPQFTSLNDVWRVGIIVIETLIKAAAYLTVGFIIWGGVKYLKSQGEPGETTQARQIIHNAVFGLLICLIAIAIVQFIALQFN